MTDDIKQTLDAALAHHRASRLKEAVALYTQALERDPENADALHLLGIATAQSGDPRRAEELIRRALAINPTEPLFHQNLGKALVAQGRWKDAAASHRRAAETAPAFGEAWWALGVALQACQDFAGAEAAYRQCLAVTPNDVRAVRGLGIIFSEQNRLAEAAAYLNQSIQREPGRANDHARLGNVLGRLGLVAEAITEFRRCLELMPQNTDARDNLIFNLLALPSATNSDLANELAAYGRAYEGPPAATSFANRPDPERRLRIAYISSSLLFGHNVFYVMEWPLRAYDRAQFDIFIYGDVPYHQDSHAPLRANLGACRDTTGLDDDAVADLIRSDGIDILVSVLGRGSALPRHSVLFRRPAPIQMAYQWVVSTGIPPVDYWIADAAGVPATTQEPFHERIVRLPQFLVFQPPPGAPEVAPLPATQNGFVTFGSFANTFKLNDELFATWASILARVPRSRLVLKSEPLADPPTRALVDTRLRRAGLPMDRIDVLPRTPGRTAHLARYGEIDISLDTFPYTFGNTALESLWMGVPVVSLAGPRFASRITFSILTAAGFPDLAAPDLDGFIRKAVDLAGDVDALAAWRRTARQRISTSALMDYTGHVRALEQTYREAWRRWCASAA